MAHLLSSGGQIKYSLSYCDMLNILSVRHAFYPTEVGLVIKIIYVQESRGVRHVKSGSVFSVDTTRVCTRKRGVKNNPTLEYPGVRSGPDDIATWIAFRAAACIGTGNLVGLPTDIGKAFLEYAFSPPRNRSLGCDLMHSYVIHRKHQRRILLGVRRGDKST